MSVQDLTASLDLKQNLNIYATCKQFDSLNLILSIYDNSLQADLTNYNVRLRAMKADKIPLIQEHVGITRNNNVVNIEADEQLTTTAGKTPIELQFIDNTTGKKKATFNLVLIVVPSTVNINGTISTATYTLLEELENKLDQASDFFENIGEATEINTELKDTTIPAANVAKNNLESSTDDANASKLALDQSKTSADNSKIALDESIEAADYSKSALDLSKTNADNSKNALDMSIDEANQFVADHPDASNLIATVAEHSTQLSDIVINVKTFNAKGDGSTDDTIAIKDALTYLKNLGGGKLFFPQGNYKITSNIAIPNKIILQGVKGKSIIFTDNNFMYNNNYPFNEMTITNEHFATSYSSETADDIIIKDMVFETRDTINTVTLPYTFIGFANTKNIEIVGTKILCNNSLNVGRTNFDIYACNRNVHIHNCYFENNTGSTRGGAWVRNISNGDENNRSENITIENNTFIKNSQDESLAVYGYIGILRDVKILNNTFKHTASSVNTILTIGSADATVGGDGTNSLLENVVFSGNIINVNYANSKVLQIGMETALGKINNVIINNNVFNLSSGSSLARIISVYTANTITNISVKNNNISYTGITDIKSAISGNYVDVIGNIINGNYSNCLSECGNVANNNITHGSSNYVITFYACKQIVNNYVIAKHAGSIVQHDSAIANGVISNNYFEKTLGTGFMIRATTSNVTNLDIDKNTFVFDVAPVSPYRSLYFNSSGTSLLRITNNRLISPSYTYGMWLQGLVSYVSNNYIYNYIDTVQENIDSNSIFRYDTNLQDSLPIGMIIYNKNPSTPLVLGWKKIATGHDTATPSNIWKTMNIT